ncbi:MAG: hypothetical protein Q4B58_02520 [Bacteroidales bacterium]|nr:hypothetical protein [Bacteroidales bacterium]
MKIFKYLPVFMTVAVALSSCFKPEEPNSECDILSVSVHVDNPKAVFFQETDTLIEPSSSSTYIEFNVRNKSSIGKMSPVFTLTPGATIYPENGSEQDFSEGPVYYTVTSEDQ